MYDDEDAPVIEFVNVTTASASSTHRVATLQAVGVGAVGDDAGAERFDGVELAQPSGLFAVPTTTANTEAVIVRRGDEAVALVVIDKGAPPQNVEAGETRLHGVGGGNATTVIRLRADGSIEITAKTGVNISLNVDGAGDVVLDGGLLKVARATDPVRVGTITGTAGPYPVTFVTTLVDADGAPVSTVTGPTATLSGVVSNAGGAPNVKA